MALVFTNQAVDATSTDTVLTGNMVAVQITGVFGTASVETLLTSDGKVLSIQNTNFPDAFLVVGGVGQSVRFKVNNSNAATSITVSIV